MQHSSAWKLSCIGVAITVEGDRQNRLSTMHFFSGVSLSSLYKNMDAKKISLVTLSDLSKAYHSVHHGIIWLRLCNTIIDTFWFQDYLYKELKYMRLCQTWGRSTFGVPQGSILGPILFTLLVRFNIYLWAQEQSQIAYLTTQVSHLLTPPTNQGNTSRIWASMWTVI